MFCLTHLIVSLMLVTLTFVSNNCQITKKIGFCILLSCQYNIVPNMWTAVKYMNTYKYWEEKKFTSYQIPVNV